MNIFLNVPRATAAQVKYINILLDDVGLSERKRRVAHLREWSKRQDINYPDDLTLAQASIVISRLLELKGQHEDYHEKEYGDETED